MRLLSFFCLYIFSGYLTATPIPAKELFRSPAMSQVTFTPDNKKLSALMFDGDGSYLSYIDFDNKEYQPIARFDSKDRLDEYVWINDRTIYISYYYQGKPRKALLKLTEKNDEITYTVVTLPADGYLVDPLISDVNNILYAKNHYDDRPSNRLYKITLEQLENNQFKESVIVEKRLKNVASFSYDEMRKSLFAVTVDIESKTGEVLYRTDGEKRWKLLFKLDNSDTSFDPIGFINDNVLAVLSNKNTDKVALYEFDVRAQTLGKVLYEHPKYDLVDGKLDVVTGGVKLVRYVENGHHVSHFFDDGLNQVYTQFNDTFSGKSTVISARSTDNNVMVLFTYASDDPGSFYLFDKKNSKADLLSELYPNLANYKLRPTISFAVESVEGINVEAYLTLPEDSLSNGVLLVMPHGGPVGVRDYNYFNSEVQYFTSRGFAVLRVNFRGSLGYGKAFLNSGKGEFGKAIEQDITAAVKLIRQKHQFKKMCAIGASYGGYSSLMLAIKHPDDYQCVVASYGIYDLPLLFNANNIKVLEEYRKNVSEVVGEFSDELVNYSPVYLAETINSPTLLIAGKKDRIADFEHSMRMEYILSQFGKEFETLYYENTGHGQNSWYWQRHESAFVADYFQRTLDLTPYHQMKGVDSQEAKKLAEDVVIIADGYHFDNKAPNNKVSAFKYYRMAAQMGEGRAAYIYGRLLIKKGEDLQKGSTITAGELAGVDDKEEAQTLIKKGLTWIEKASTSGNADASYWLGLVYELGKLINKDWDKSLGYYSAAVEQGYDANALVRLGRHHCLSVTSLRDIERCSELLSLSKYETLPENLNKNTVTGKSRDTLRWALGDIYAKGNFNQKELNLLKSVVKSEYEASAIEIKLEDVEFGSLTYSNLYKRYIVEDDEQASFLLSDELEIGMIFDVIFSEEDKKVALLAKWTLQDSDGQEEVFDSALMWGDGNEDRWKISLKLDGENVSQGKVTLQISDLNGRTLASKSASLL